MKLGPFEVRRRTVTAATAPVAQPGRERGGSGTVNLQGYLQPDEYNRDLRWPLSLRTYLEMRRSDGSVREALWYLYAPLLAATWDIEPAGDDPLDLEIAAFAHKAVFDWPQRQFKDTLRQMLLYLPQGYQMFELVEGVFTEKLTVEDKTTGDKTELPERQFVAWSKIAHRRPETVYRWITDPAAVGKPGANVGDLQAVQQRVWKDDGYEEPIIPVEDLLLLVNEQEGDDYTGVSILRSAYKSWWLKETVEKIAGVAYERHGVGVPVGYIPEDSKNDTAMMQRMEDMLAGLRAGEFSYLVMPGPKGQVGATPGSNGGFWVEILSPSGGIPDFVPFLTYLRGDIKGNVLARFSELGHGSTGARAVADPQSKIWYDALGAVGDYIAAELSAVLERLVAKNYSTDRYPKVVVRDLDARNLAEFADANSKLVAVGAIINDKPYRDAVRDKMNLPDEDPDDPKILGLTALAPPVEQDPTAQPTDNTPGLNGKPPADQVPAPTFK